MKYDFNKMINNYLVKTLFLLILETFELEADSCRLMTKKNATIGQIQVDSPVV